MTTPIQCPHCGSSVPEESRFCPVCRQPRTGVEAQLRQVAASTGQPYEELLLRAQEQDALNPQAYVAPVEEPPAPKPDGRRPALAGGGIVVLFLCVVVLVLSGTGDDDRQDRPTRTPSFGAVVTPTKTPSVAASRPPATATTRTSSGASSTDETIYVALVTPIMEGMAESMGNFSRLMSNPRIGQNDWTISVVAEIMSWDGYYADLQRINPPPQLRPAHNKFLEGTREIASASDDIIAGIDNLDANRIDRATDAIMRGNALIMEATDLLPAR